MVRVAVASDRVEGEHHFGLQRADVGDHLPGNFLQGMVDERVRVAVVRCAGHAGIAVIQKMHAGKPQGLRGAAQFNLAQLRDRAVASQELFIDHADLSARGTYQVDGMALAGVQGQRPAHAKGFIIRVGQDSKDGLIGHNFALIIPYCISLV